MTREMAGPSSDCKPDREGFDSLPRLKLLPQDYTKVQLVNLMMHHMNKSVDAQTKLVHITKRLIEVGKELSNLKRKVR